MPPPSHATKIHMSSPPTASGHALALHQQRCTHQTGATLSASEQQVLMSQLHGWQIEDTAGDGPQPLQVLSKTFKLPDFHRTMAFVNAVAWIAHEQDHHPDMALRYGQCTIRWSTHSVGGLSINDFICAARVDALAS